MAYTVRPRKSLSCKLMPPPPPPAGPFKLFVRFPSDVEDIEDTRVHSITIESDSVSVTALKARIELLLGLPADAYELRYGQKRLRDVDRLRIGRDVDNGGLLTACAFNDQVRCVAEAVYRQDALQIQDICGVTNIRDERAVPRKVSVAAECRMRSRTAAAEPRCHDGVASDALGVCLIIDTNLAFVAMCLSAACGHHDVVEMIGNADGDGAVRKMATPFGRTPLHIACANDNDRVVNLLLAFHYDPSSVDGAQHTPVSIAQRFEAGLCSLLMRRHQDKCRRQRQKDAAARRLDRDGDAWFEMAAAQR